MIELIAHGSERLFELYKIDEHTSASERRAFYVSADGIIVPVQVFTFSVVIAEKMRCGKIRFNAYFKHKKEYNT